VSGERRVPGEDSASGKSIRFPALTFSADGILYAFDSLDRITTCTKRGYKTGFYKGLVLIDSDGTRFRAVDARHIRTLPPRSFGGLLEWLTGNPHWKVDLIFEAEASKASLDEVKQMISTAFRKNDETWQALVDFDEFRDRLERTTSLGEVFAAFREFNVVEGNESVGQ